MDKQKTLYHLRKAYKACPKDYTCRPQMKAWCNLVQAAHELNVPLYIEQTGVMYRFYRDIADKEGPGTLYDAAMAVSFAP